MKVTGGQALVGQLIREGVRDLFGIPGVQLDWAVDAICDAQDELRYFVPRHEQTASYMADGYARSTGREGVCMVVPGPGVLNALSGLATSYACSAPVLFIGGQIPSPTIGKGHGQLHEIADQSGILTSLTKWHALAKSPAELPTLVHEAVVQLRSGHPRPVALEVPPDVLQASADVTYLPAAEKAPTPPARDAVGAAAALLRAAKFPVIHIGGGAAAAQAEQAVQALAERLQAPVVMTEGARGVLASDHPLALIGLGGRAVYPKADVILVAGSRFVDALAAPTFAAPGAKFIYVNIDPRHLGAPRVSGLEVLADAGLTLQALANALKDFKAPSRAADVARVKAWCAEQIATIVPQADYVAAIRAATPPDTVIVSELTQVGYYANVAMPVSAPRSYLTPGYQGTLGYGFPTALGAAVGNPDRFIVSLTGDGGFGWGMQELATAARYKLKLAVIVFADGQYGNVRRIQQRVFGRTFATDVQNPNFALLAQAFGVRHARAESPEALGEALVAAQRHGGPTLIEAPVGAMTSPWPLIHAFVPGPTPPPPDPLSHLPAGGA